MNRAKKKKVTHPTAEPADDPMETTVSVAEPPQQPPPAPEPPPPSELVCAEEADDSDAAEMKSAREELKHAKHAFEVQKRRWEKTRITYSCDGQDATYSPYDQPSVVARVMQRLRAADAAMEDAHAYRICCIRHVSLLNTFIKFKKLHEQQPENIEFLTFLLMATERYVEFCDLQVKLQNEDVLVSEMSSLAVKSEKQYNLAGTWGVTF